MVGLPISSFVTTLRAKSAVTVAATDLSEYILVGSATSSLNTSPHLERAGMVIVLT